MEAIQLKPIGIIHSPFNDLKNMPIQPTGAKGINGEIELYEKYVDGIKDLDGFSHIILLYHFHKANGYSLSVVPFLDKQEHGLFATRAPKRPNPIGLSIVKITRIEENKIFISDVDILNGTPVLDIKPYVPKFDYRKNVRIGWLEKDKINLEETKADDRFI